MQPLTQKVISATARRVGRKQVNFDKMPGRFPEHTFARMDAVLQTGETRTEFLKEAVDRELKRREDGGG